MLTALPDAANDLTLPCHEQWAGAATAWVLEGLRRRQLVAIQEVSASIDRLIWVRTVSASHRSVWIWTSSANEWWEQPQLCKQRTKFIEHHKLNVINWILLIHSLLCPFKHILTEISYHRQYLVRHVCIMGIEEIWVARLLYVVILVC